jgi:nitronate monooxygenase
VEFPPLRHPIVLAPLAGGPWTPELAAAVSRAGGLGFVAAGYRTVEDFRGDLRRVRELTDAPFGVNLFLVGEAEVDEAAVTAYAERLTSEGPVGEPRFDDDGIAAKLDAVLEAPPAVVSFTFACPTADVVDRLHERRVGVWVTVTEPDEAVAAVGAGADALVVQGVEAGGHRGTWVDADGAGELALLPLLRLVRRAVDVPLVATGGIADGAAVAAALVAGAEAAQVGTAFLSCPEAGTSAAHRLALAGASPTALTRAFTGRRGRGIVNRFLLEHDGHAPAAYPHVHHVTAPLRAAARAAGDPESINLWAGQAYALTEALPAAELVARLSEDARAALADAATRLR